MAKKKKKIVHLINPESEHQKFITLCGFGIEKVKHSGRIIDLKAIESESTNRACHKCKYILRNQTASFKEKVQHGK